MSDIDHVIAWELRNALTRIANLEAELAASHLAAQRLASEAVAEEREAIATFVFDELEDGVTSLDDVVAAIRARGKS